MRRLADDLVALFDSLSAFLADLTPDERARIIGPKQPPLTKEETMAKQITCRDAGMDCPGQFKVETEDELMQHVQIHAEAAHPDLRMTPEFQRQVKSLIQTV